MTSHENIKHHNVRFYIEENCLASTSFYYLGHRLTPDVIKPQEKKIKAILNIAQPSNLRELRRFISFVQCYRDMFRRRSDIIHPLTSETSNSVKKFAWTPEMDTHIKRIISQNRLLLTLKLTGRHAV